MLILVFSDPLQQEEQMGWHPSVVKRTLIRVIGENFSDFLIELAGSSNYLSSSYRGSTVFALSTNPVNVGPSRNFCHCGDVPLGPIKPTLEYPLK